MFGSTDSFNKYSVLTRRFIAILLISFSYSLAMGIENPVLPLYIRSFGVPMSTVGLVFTFQMLGYAIFEPSFGWLSDKVGRKKLIISTSIANSLVLFFITRVSEFWQFFPLAFFLAVTMSGLTVTTPASVADIVSPSKRGKSYGFYMAIRSVGQVIGALIGGYVANITDYSVPFYISALFMIVIPLIALTLIEPKKIPEHITKSSASNENMKRSEAESNFKKIVATSGFLPLLLTFALYIFTSITLTRILPIYVKESAKFRATEIEVGIMTAIASAVIGVTQIVFGMLSDRVGKKRLIIIGFVLGGLSYFGFLVIGGVMQLYLIRAILAASSGAIVVCQMALLTENVPERSYGTAIGLYYIGGDLGGMLGPFLVGYVYDRWSFETAIYLMATIQFLGAFLTFTLNKKSGIKQSKTT